MEWIKYALTFLWGSASASSIFLTIYVNIAFILPTLILIAIAIALSAVWIAENWNN